MKKKNFTFSVLPYRDDIPTSGDFQAFLLTDNWDDWSEFATMYVLFVFDENGKQHTIGGVKIGQFNMKKDQYRPALPDSFEHLDDSFFSLGQADTYYEGLTQLGSSLRDKILTSLRDVAADSELFERALSERVTIRSLLRSVRPTSVRGQFRRLSRGGARLSSYKFTYDGPHPVRSKNPHLSLSFEVVPESHPPTNIQVLIGPNGVGKTYLLNRMAQALVDTRTKPSQTGAFRFLTSNDAPSELTTTDISRNFANLALVTFSALDAFETLRVRKGKATGVQCSYVGLRRLSRKTGRIGAPLSLNTLTTEFVNSLRLCFRGDRLGRWRRALNTLDSDPIFKDAQVSQLAEEDNKSLHRRASALFRNLSAGHKIVLLIVTRLVETAEERTLILMDEPEAHLHPPLLSALIRALSDLMVDRNGVAIIATHSPVVLQEVPKNCVWKLGRSGKEVRADRPEAETFGENVGVLTREVFGLQVTQSGFHKMLSDALDVEPTFKSALGRFNNELGAEAKAILQALYVIKQSPSSQ